MLQWSNLELISNALFFAQLRQILKRDRHKHMTFAHLGWNSDGNMVEWYSGEIITQPRLENYCHDFTRGQSHVAQCYATVSETPLGPIEVTSVINLLCCRREEGVCLWLRGNRSLPTVHKGNTPCKGCCPPRRWVWVGSLPPLTHRRGGQHPLQGVWPLCTVGRDRFPLSHKQTPSSLLPHSTFMTEVTSMAWESHESCPSTQSTWLPTRKAIFLHRHLYLSVFTKGRAVYLEGKYLTWTI